MTYNGRRGPNITQFLRELHENPALVENDPAFSMDDQDLSMFTNTEFFDLETGQNTDFQPQPEPPAKPLSESASSSAVSPLSEDTMTTIADFPSIDFMAAGDFNFPDFGATYASPTIPSYQDGLGNLHQPIQPAQPVYPPATARQPHSRHASAYATPGPVPPRIAAAEKRKADVLTPGTRAMSFEEQTRLAAEEDKRRRNTAASARFRIKKKQREQALEKSAKDMNDKVTAMENRISQLETENKWLKSIVLEKNAGNEEFLSKLLADFKSKHPNSSSRSSIEAEMEAKVETVSDEENETRDSSG